MVFLPFDRQAAKAGATMVGLILWPKSKRSVDLAKAKEMAAAVIEAGATPVAVFVDEDTETVRPRRICCCLGVPPRLHHCGVPL